MRSATLTPTPRMRPGIESRPNPLHLSLRHAQDRPAAVHSRRLQSARLVGPVAELGSLIWRLRSTPYHTEHMKALNPISVLIAAGLCSLVACTTSDHTHRAWEYRVVEAVTTSSSDLQARLNQAGTDGFTVVSSQILPGDANHAPLTVVILKRVKP